MQVKLISHSQTDGKELLMSTSATELVAYCARVSNPDNQNNKETSEKLIKYLMKHKHWSPLEMVSVCLEIETTRDIGRQILRHRSFSFQEFSQRYADPTKDLEFVTREARLQDEKNRQNSIEIGTDIESFQIAKQWDEYQKDIIRYARQAYCWAIENGIAKEQARAVLPEGNTMSRMYVNGTLRSWIHYIELRGANGTQKEHIAIANEVAKVISNVFPLAKEFKGKEI
jgi:thymidylate synthase (FAD)|tara:strand:+ start:62 stop:745 length:684 start_codon:yes stop_codon:yes gene_type:complete